MLPRNPSHCCHGISRKVPSVGQELPLVALHGDNLLLSLTVFWMLSSKFVLVEPDIS